MAHLRLTRRYRFCAAHRLHTPLLTEEENRRVYGKCNNPYGHGHDYTLEVSVCGELDPLRGRLIGVAQLDALVQDVILTPFDHCNLNTQVAEFAARVPTTEVLAEVVARRLAEGWALRCGGLAVELEKVRIWETRRNIFEVRVTAVPPPEKHSHEIIELSGQVRH